MMVDMKPSIGRTVHYTLDEHDANQVNRRRNDALQNTAARAADGAQVHTGNRAAAGQVFPLVITRVFADPADVTEQTAVNGQVLLDGNDTLWVTSRTQGEGLGRWREPARA